VRLTLAANHFLLPAFVAIATNSLVPKSALPGVADATQISGGCSTLIGGDSLDGLSQRKQL
jgi:hypothetical protein